MGGLARNPHFILWRRSIQLVRQKRKDDETGQGRKEEKKGKCDEKRVSKKSSQEKAPKKLITPQKRVSFKAYAE